jgi:glutamine amidotransferase
MKRVCILDYGLGNTKSLYNSLRYLGYETNFFSEKKNDNYDVICIPGVGSFSKASDLILNNKDYYNFIQLNKKNCVIFGICLGMQILLDEGFEFGRNNGLSLIGGEVIKLKSNKKIILPFVGYQSVSFNKDYKNFNKFDKSKFYFVHSYFPNKLKNKNILAKTSSQNIDYNCAVISENIIGTQFHPEKSGNIGLELIKEIVNI